MKMAVMLDIPLKIGGVVIRTLYEAPIALLVLGFFTLILTGIAFVSAATSILSSPAFMPLKVYRDSL